MPMYLHCDRGQQNAREIEALKTRLAEMEALIDDLTEEIRERNQTISPQIYAEANQSFLPNLS